MDEKSIILVSEVIKCTKNDWTGSTPSIILRSKSNNNNNDNNNSKFHVIVAYLEMVFNKFLLHQHYRIAKPSQTSCCNYRWLDFNAHKNFVIKFFVNTKIFCYENLEPYGTCFLTQPDALCHISVMARLNHSQFGIQGYINVCCLHLQTVSLAICLHEC